MQIMKQLNAEDVAKKIYNSLFFSTGDIDINMLMGKWYTVSIYGRLDAVLI